jgi:hypothetical protein
MRIYCILVMLVVLSAIIVTVVDGQHLGRRRRSLTLVQLDHEELLKMDDNPIKAEIVEMEVQVSKVAYLFWRAPCFCCLLFAFQTPHELSFVFILTDA